MRIDGGFLTGPDSMPSRTPLLSNAPLMEAFATEYQKRPSRADVAYWRKMRREVVCGNLCHFVVSADHNRQTFSNARDVTWKQCSVKAGRTHLHVCIALNIIIDAPASKMRDAFES